MVSLLPVNVDLRFPPKTRPLFNPLINRLNPGKSTHRKKRYVILYGGRGSAKSWTIASFLVFEALTDKKLILCTREIQKSMRNSVYRLLKNTIDRYGLNHYFRFTQASIVCLRTGSEFIFEGLWNNEDGIKSTEGADYCWIEEAQSVSAESIRSLLPTIRKPGSQIIISYNPTLEEDPVHERLTLAALAGKRDDCELIPINWSDNEWFPDELRAEMEYDKAHDYNMYLHIWEGQCVVHSEAQIFNGKFEVCDFETPDDAKFLFGGDYGDTDPMTLIRGFIKDDCLYIDQEAWGVRVDIDKYEQFYDSVEESRNHKIIGDSSYPETIRYLRQRGFSVFPAKKGKNSVMEGIKRLRKFKKIYIHTDCKRTAAEFRLYSYKVDKHSGEISSIPEDKNNHCIDAIRYMTEGLITYKSKARVRSVSLGRGERRGVIARRSGGSMR